MTIETFASRDAWLAQTSQAVIAVLKKAAVSGKKDFHACLAGGSTPKELYRAIASSGECKALSAGLQIHLWQGDERCVAAGSPFLNSLMIAEAFRQTLEGAGRWPNPPIFHRWHCDIQNLTPETSALQYTAELENQLAASGTDAFDLCILGIGADGHTASLFSLHDAMDSAKPLAFPTVSPQEPRLRVTLRGSFLKSSGEVMVIAAGKEKKAVIDAIGMRKMIYPAEAVLPERATIFYLET